jgi:transcriptional regulator GlxA family with amidase domain
VYHVREPSRSRDSGRNRPENVIAAIVPTAQNDVVSRRVVFVVYPGITALDLVGPHEVLGAAGSYELTVAASIPGVVRPTRGPGIVSDRLLASVRGPIDTLIVVGGDGAFAATKDAQLVRAVGRLATRSRRVASVCTGSFVLAAAGVLDGKRATTHWSACEYMAKRYPAVTVDPEPIFVRDGNIWTSAGVTAGMDLALALVADDLGRDVALRVARQLVMYVQRPGGQSQFSAQLGAQIAGRDPLRELQEWVTEHPDEDLSVEQLSARAGMSPRHFARVFRAEVGCTPAVYVERVRLEVARRLLETTSLSVDEISRAAGFGTVETMRRTFSRRIGASPTDYRERFPARQSA